MTMKFKKIALSLLAMSAVGSAAAQTNEMKVKVNKLGAEVQPTMYGILTSSMRHPN